jgi:hypothetical protein
MSVTDVIFTGLCYGRVAAGLLLLLMDLLAVESAYYK